MDAKKKLDIAFLWHMHQPFYKDTSSGEYCMPWVRLHAVKDYYPMAAIAGRFENIRVTFNIVPALVEQINDYVNNNSSDNLLDLTLKKPEDLEFREKFEILNNFFKVNFQRFIEPNARYSELLIKKGVKPQSRSAVKKAVESFSNQDVLDLQVLFNFAWFHSINIEEDVNLKNLAAKGKNYTEEDKLYVISKQREIMARIMPLYRRLSDEGRVEITTTPYYHPILPLLCDTSIARVSSPGVDLPRRFAHPEDARWHIAEAIKYHTAEFGRPPRGMWPSEGSVSDAALELAISLGIKWVATDEDILFNSLSLYDKSYKGIGLLDRRLIYRPYKFKKDSKSLAMIFRDKNLSDMISFSYHSWDQRRAAEDLLGHFRNIADNLRRDTDRGLVAIVMDGENAWEYFEDNGRAFFETLYSNLERMDNITSATISDFLEEEPPRKTISNIFPGSWINHDFEIWIGQEQDNASWEYLAKTRADLIRAARTLDKKGGSSKGAVEKAWRELYRAEGSDWNWWYGGKLHSGGDKPFDKLYRAHLKNVYKMVKKPIPDFLQNSIA